MKIKIRLKSVNKYIIIVLISFLITSTIVGVSASTILEASEVSYTGNGQSNVEGALDDLYSKTKLKKFVYNNKITLNYSEGGCKEFKTDSNSNTWVTIIKSSSANSFCDMTFDLNLGDFNQIYYVYAKLTSTADDTDKFHFTGGTHYYNFIPLYGISFDSSILPSYDKLSPWIFRTASSNSYYAINISFTKNNRHTLNFIRTAASDGNNFQIRGEPYLSYIEIYYE